MTKSNGAPGRGIRFAGAHGGKNYRYRDYQDSAGWTCAVLVLDRPAGLKLTTVQARAEATRILRQHARSRGRG